MIQWTFDLLESSGGHLGIYFDGFAAFVPQQRLNVAQVGAEFQQVGGKAVPEGVSVFLPFALFYPDLHPF